MKTRYVEFEKDTAVIDELTEVRELVEGFQNGSVPNETFKPRRLVQGIYGQRQANVQMLRIKLPGGSASYDQWKTITDQAKRFTQKQILHITTRQAIQLHYVKTADVPEILEALANVGVTTREACGNSLRNITGSPFSGSLITEVFDIMPTVSIVAKFFLRHKDSQNLPRKFKIAFSESAEDYAVTGMHDVGAIAKIKDGKPGFKVMVGGGLGSQPFPAEVYSEFITPDEIILHILAIVRIFFKYGERKKKMKARLKFLLKNWGIERFIEECQKEITLIKEENIDVPVAPILLEDREDFDTSNPYDKETEKEKYIWFSKNVMPTKRKNEWMVIVQSPLGDVFFEEAYLLADKHKVWQGSYSGSEFITVTDDQNFLLKGILASREELKQRLDDLYDTLKKMNFASVGYHDISDPVSCPGTSTCNLGITHSKGLARAIRELIKDRFVLDDRFEGATIHISGCPNSCGRHHLGTLGFFGRSDKLSNDIQAPAYNVMLGGHNDGDGNITIAKRCGKVLAKRVPQFIEEVLARYEECSEEGETFVSFCKSLTKDEVNEMIAKFDKEVLPVEGSEKANYDWDKDIPYVVEFGEGECGL